MARAATNAFSMDVEEEHPSVAMIVGRCHYSLQSEVLIKNCGLLGTIP